MPKRHVTRKKPQYLPNIFDSEEGRKFGLMSNTRSIIKRAAASGRKMLSTYRPVGMTNNYHDIKSCKIGQIVTMENGREYRAVNHLTPIMQKKLNLPPTHFIKLGERL